MGTLVRVQQTSADDDLSYLEKRIGNIDEFVANELGMAATFLEDNALPT